MTLPTGLLTSAYLGAMILFILSLSGLSHQETARKGNLFGLWGMVLATVATVAYTFGAFGKTPFEPSNLSALPYLIVPILLGTLVGIRLAIRVQMTAMPELVAILHSFVGLAAVLVGFSSYLEPRFPISNQELTLHHIEIFAAIFIGALTFTGSVAAFLKLRGLISGKPLLIPARHAINLTMLVTCVGLGFLFFLQPELGVEILFVMAVLSGLLGLHKVLAIGGADMPVVVSMLNSYSGWAAAAAGFMLKNDLLIVTGALVGSSGAILSHIMCKAMNRSLLNVILGGFGTDVSSSSPSESSDKTINEATVEQTVQELNEAQDVVVIPGYGMAVSQAQHSLSEIVKSLRNQGKNVRFAIHPVAGRLPGHMNVLLAEANVPYDIVLEMDEINPDIVKSDVALVIGANDIVNPKALEDEQSPLAGMPVIEAWGAKTVVVFKRSLASGYAGIDNSLFYKANTRMLFGDAKRNVDAILAQLQN